MSINTLKIMIFVAVLWIVIPTASYGHDTSVSNSLDSNVRVISGDRIEDVTTKALQDLSLYISLAEISKPTSPFVYGQYFIFVHYDEIGKQRALISFDHESYSKLHHYVRLVSNPQVNVFIVKRSYTDITLHYRVILDGVWGIDVNNNAFHEDMNNIYVSSVDIPKVNPFFLPSYITINDSTIRFYLYLNDNDVAIKNIYNDMVMRDGISYKEIFLVGNFTGWDPLLVHMQKDKDYPNLYYADITLKEGNYYYYYQMGSESVLDPKNQNIVKRNSLGGYVNAFSVSRQEQETSGAMYLRVSTMENY